MDNLTKARNISLDKKRKFAHTYNAYNIRSMKKAYNSPMYRYNLNKRIERDNKELMKDVDF